MRWLLAMFCEREAMRRAHSRAMYVKYRAALRR